MDLETLKKRLSEIENAIVGCNNQIQAFMGHKNEVMHWISEFEKVAAAAAEVAEVVAPLVTE